MLRSLSGGDSMMRTTAAAILAAALAGCSGTETHTRGLESQNLIRVDLNPGPGYDLTVEIKGLVDFGWNPDNPETRKETALAAVKSECPAARIVHEDRFSRGESLRGPIYTYYVRLRCRPA